MNIAADKRIGVSERLSYLDKSAIQLRIATSMARTPLGEQIVLAVFPEEVEYAYIKELSTYLRNHTIPQYLKGKENAKKEVAIVCSEAAKPLLLSCFGMLASQLILVQDIYNSLRLDDSKGKILLYVVQRKIQQENSMVAISCLGGLDGAAGPGNAEQPEKQNGSENSIGLHAEVMKNRVKWLKKQQAPKE